MGQIQLDDRKHKLKAKEELLIQIPASNNIRFYEAEDTFQVSLNGGAPISMTRGREVEIDSHSDDDLVNTIKLINPHNFAITVALYYGRGVRVKDDTLNIVDQSEIVIKGAIERIIESITVEKINQAVPIQTAEIEAKINLGNVHLGDLKTIGHLQNAHLEDIKALLEAIKTNTQPTV